MSAECCFSTTHHTIPHEDIFVNWTQVFAVCLRQIVVPGTGHNIPGRHPFRIETLGAPSKHEKACHRKGVVKESEKATSILDMTSTPSLKV